MSFHVISPVGHPRTIEAGVLAPRLRSLDGARLGVIVNEAGSSMATDWEGISGRLTGHLQARHSLRGVIREIKPMMSAPAPSDLLERIARGSDGVVNGLGK